MREILLILITCVSFVTAVLADRPMTPDERRERVESVIIGKFATELELSPEDAEKFYPRLRQFRMETEEMQRELNLTRMRLDELSGQKRSAEDGKDEVKSLITKSRDLQTGILTKREILLTDLAEFLTPQQVSRCAILLDDIPRRIRQFMDERGEGGGEGKHRNTNRPVRHAR